MPLPLYHESSIRWTTILILVLLASVKEIYHITDKKGGTR
jgi:hypothetical protein